MAYLSSSPPPMMPEDDSEEEDSLADGFADLSESDNTSYDLTGLSDKLHSIPKETIHVTPKEFAMTDPVGRNVVIRLNGLGVPQSEDVDEIPDLDNDSEEDEKLGDFNLPEFTNGVCDSSPVAENDPNFYDESVKLKIVKIDAEQKNSDRLADSTPEARRLNCDGIYKSESETKHFENSTAGLTNHCRDSSPVEIYSDLTEPGDYPPATADIVQPSDVKSSSLDLSLNTGDYPPATTAIDQPSDAKSSSADLSLNTGDYPPATAAIVQPSDVKSSSDDLSLNTGDYPPATAVAVQPSDVKSSIADLSLNTGDYPPATAAIVQPSDEKDIFETKLCDSSVENTFASESESEVAFQFENPKQEQSAEVIPDHLATSEKFASDPVEHFNRQIQDDASGLDRLSFQDIDERQLSQAADTSDDFGDFANFESASWVQPEIPARNTTSQPVDPESVPNQPDDDEDDDFGDFDSAEFVGPATFPSKSIFTMLQPRITSVILDLFSITPLPNAACDNQSKVLNLNPTSDAASGDNIWTQIDEIETTPALQMIWNKTNSQNHLMKLLKIDPRNIVLETKPRKYSPGGVPAFAMGLSTSAVLQPVKVETVISTIKQTPNAETAETKETVPQVVFDWQNSGLKNPLEQNGARPSTPTIVGFQEKPLGSLNEGPIMTSQPGTISSMTSQSGTIASTSKPRSREAAAILESFPLLNFMQAQTLTMPPIGKIEQ